MVIDLRKVRSLMLVPEDFLANLGGLTNSQFRKLSQQLAERLLPEMSVDEFWPLFSALFFSEAKNVSSFSNSSGNEDWPSLN